MCTRSSTNIKLNTIKFQEGDLSNEPDFIKRFIWYKNENLVYIKKVNKKLSFQNLTLAPIEKELINFKKLKKKEKDYLFNYHLNVYSKLSPFLKKDERKWLASFI